MGWRSTYLHVTIQYDTPPGDTEFNTVGADGWRLTAVYFAAEKWNATFTKHEWISPSTPEQK